VAIALADALFDGVAKNPTAPEYWWAYALLLSSMIPSFINLAISGMAPTRGRRRQRTPNGPPQGGGMRAFLP
jgi:hypothetical protein